MDLEERVTALEALGEQQAIVIASLTGALEALRCGLLATVEESHPVKRLLLFHKKIETSAANSLELAITDGFLDHVAQARQSTAEKLNGAMANAVVPLQAPPAQSQE